MCGTTIIYTAGAMWAIIDGERAAVIADRLAEEVTVTAPAWNQYVNAEAITEFMETHSFDAPVVPKINPYMSLELPMANQLLEMDTERIIQWKL